MKVNECVQLEASLTTRRRRRLVPGRAALLLVGLLVLPQSARASLFHGETLDAVANVISWIVLIIVPVVAIGAFWLVHILPEKIAERRRHPQAKAIQCLCLLSLVFGGILWPLAWIWAYTKPVLHRLAYGTDVDDSHGHGEEAKAEARVKPLEASLSKPEVHS